MKAAEITDRLLTELQTGTYRAARLNYANGDMVGHTGVRDAAILAVEVVDLELGRLIRFTQKAGGILIVTADHGNADEMYERAKDGSVTRDSSGRPRVKTSHTLNPVPLFVYAPGVAGLKLANIDKPGLGNVAATNLNLLGFEAPTDYMPSLVAF
jgi:2,3-bisphosphoglycerate-independent phosphoglycerate mutase